MCGRYSLASGPEELVEAFDVPGPTFEYRPRYNIAPGQEAPVVAEDAHGRRMGLMRWGLVPSWREAADGGHVNARAETVATRPSFREAFARRRCLVPADGFYEWARASARRTPYWVHPAAGGVLSFAAIWERWEGPGRAPRYGFAILTTDANAEVAPVHDRMPVVIAPADRARWLARDSDEDGLRALLRPAADGTFATREVSTRVNRPSEDDEGLREPV